jgi:hypothetical protein
MVNAKEFYSSNYVKAEEVKGGEICELLDEGEIAEITTPEGKTKSVLNLLVKINDKEKIFTPNRGNGDAFIEAWGEDTANWVGKKFQITKTKVLVFGKQKDSIIAVPIVPEKK